MNILIPLSLGLVLGYALRGKSSFRAIRRDVPLSATVLLLVFLMGVETGKVEIDAGWLTVSSAVFAVLTSAGSLLFGFLLWRWLK
ncbi:hypothetical protein [Thermococcus gorgonarius]|uniref:DUF340 domain-containing protein n=1 Tax=Thermococcus gorgonarius TaxID=71997 RepID=A0A2Z2M9A6_THEGO|nr:hypothetical protein [Thermococcus gorgonarius]ASJ01032.1 hypothetical protein A3K92_05830 [Thermococcus gorgonarius]